MSLQHHQNTWSVLVEMIHGINSARSPRELADHVVRRLAGRPECEAVGIWAISRDQLERLAAQGFEQTPSLAQIHRVIDSGTPVLIDHADAGSGHSLAFVPLTSPAGRVGALVAQLTSAAGEMLFLEAVGAYAGMALHGMLAQRDGRAAPSSTDRAWDAFLGHAAHEIKNPLASVKGYADLLLRRVSGDPADPYRKGLTIIAQQVGRMSSLLEQLSDLARIGAEPARLDRSVVDLASVLRHTAERHQSTTDNHQLRFEGADAPLLVRCDEARIRQVFDIMLGNAIKFSPQGGPIAVMLRRAPGELLEGGTGEAAIVAVSDHGIGVPEGEQDRVFERFYRGSNVAGAYRGLGGNLFIARTIVERHGGRMWLESSAAQGTSCFVALPIQ